MILDPASYEFGRYLAQRNAHVINVLLQDIYVCSIEPKKELSSVEQGIIDEVHLWPYLNPSTSQFLEDYDRRRTIKV